MLRIPQQAGEEILLRTLMKPPIVVGNYFLKWDESCTGIPMGEEGALRSFVSDLIPHISSKFFAASNEFHSSLQNLADGPKDKQRIYEMFHPQFCLSRKHRSFSYALHMDAEGRSVIFRREELVVTPGDSKISTTPPSFFVEWILGELMFDRKA